MSSVRVLLCLRYFMAIVVAGALGPMMMATTLFIWVVQCKKKKNLDENLSPHIQQAQYSSCDVVPVHMAPCRCVWSQYKWRDLAEVKQSKHYFLFALKHSQQAVNTDNKHLKHWSGLLQKSVRLLGLWTHWPVSSPVSDTRGVHSECVEEIRRGRFRVESLRPYNKLWHLL